MKFSEISGTPLFSPLSIIVALVAIVILVTIFAFKGSFIFSPGHLSSQNTRGLVYEGVSSHLEFENQCKLCHQPLFSSQGTQCLQCHQDIAVQIQQQNGLHGRWKNVDTCRTCHSDHKGQDFNMLEQALSTFDHSQTRLPLSGMHLELACRDCHDLEVFQIDPLCSDCHAEPVQHAALFPQECSECHSAQGWSPALRDGIEFNHEQTSFSLSLHQKNYQETPVTCVDCHQTGALETTLTACKDCHERQDTSFMLDHTGQYGLNCTDCHDGRDRMHNFDHQEFFILDGAHTALECQSCHADQNFHGTSTDCSDCHAEPTIHAGSFSLNCAACHTTQAWQPAELLFHTFPLDHGDKGEIACTACHLQTYASFTCDNCHDSRESKFIQKHADKNIFEDRLMDCVACHVDGKTHNETNIGS